MVNIREKCQFRTTRDTTTYGAQGMTMEGTIDIHVEGKWDAQHMYVALSRCRKISDVCIYWDPVDINGSIEICEEVNEEDVDMSIPIDPSKAYEC
jgi:hypothetical protein